MPLIPTATPTPPSLPRRSLLLQQWPLVLTLLAGLLATKIAIISALGPLFGLSRAESVRTGFILSQVQGYWVGGRELGRDVLSSCLQASLQ